MSEPRVADYDNVADRYDRRYTLLRYDGVRDALINFLGEGRPRVLEVGCGTGHWLGVAQPRAGRAAGVDLSSGMLARARAALPPSIPILRARAEDLPWIDAAFDRIYCINALHHFSDRFRFFIEARRLLRPGGGLLTVGKDPHAERDDWWVYDYFPETVAIDRARFAPVRILRGELARAGFDWAESMEADRIEATHTAAEAFAGGMVDRAHTSQLTVLSDEEFDRGVARIREADAAVDGQLQLVTDFRLFATIGWLAGP